MLTLYVEKLFVL